MRRFAMFLLASAFALFAGRTAFATSYKKLPADRILLMNNDKRSAAPVWGQGYWDTFEKTVAGGGGTNETYWVHSDEKGYAALNTNLLPGITHTLFHTNGTALWHLEHCRAGSGTIMGKSNYNYLQWYPKIAIQINPPFGPCLGTDFRNVGEVSMGNVTNAFVYSPYYDTGIGTIYFDAVNRDVANLESALKLQLATSAVDGVSLSSTNYEKFVWFDCPFDVLDVKKANSCATVSQTNVTSFVLNATEGTNVHSFRFRSSVIDVLGGYHGRIRFRIWRCSKYSKNSKELSNFILLDNVLVSYPAMGAELRFNGVYDETKKGVEVQGLQNAFDLPFFYAGGPEVSPHAFFEPVTNNAFTTTSKDFEMTNVVFNWRWTYLNQTFAPADGSWNKIKMQMNPNCHTQLVACAGEKNITFTNGVGDVEYYLTGEADIPYYQPQDYAWATVKGFGRGWSEIATNVVLRSDRAFSETGGSEFYTRIRPGESPWEKFVLETLTTVDDGVVYTNDVSMELVSAHKWRAYWEMPTNYVGGTTRFRFRGVNWQDLAVTNVAPMVNETVYGITTEAVGDMPFSGACVANGKLWGSLMPDKKSTHVLIELDDETLVFGASHADYQNFNLWTDAMRGYMGNSSSTTGVSSVKMAYPADLSGWGVSSNANPSVWDESFTLQKYNGSDYPMDEAFNLHNTPNGWTAEMGMFVKEKLEDTPTGMALQMRGQGYGSMYMQGLKESSQPTGLDTVTFRAHTAQTAGAEEFAYSYDQQSATNFAISAQMMMSVVGDAGLIPNGPSISLVANYRQKRGGYEFRITRVTSSKVKAGIYKWYKGSNNAWKCATLTEETWNTGGQLICSKDYKNWTSAYLSVYPIASRCRITAKLANARNSSEVYLDSAMTSTSFDLDCNDDGSYGSVFTSGSFGVGASGCSAVFGQILKHPMTSETKPALTKYEKLLLEITKDNWAFDGRNERLDSSIANVRWEYGVQCAEPQNDVIVSVSETGSSGWREVGRVNVDGFGFADYTVTAHTTSNCLVRLSAAGTEDDVRTDVVVDDVHVTSWGGEDRPTRTSGNSGLYEEWVCTDGWLYDVVAPGKTNVCCTLQPARGDPSYPMSLRSPLIENGLSYLVFSYTNASRYAKLLVQVATNVADAAYVNNVTESLSDEDWTTVDRYEFNLGDAYRNGGSGTRTSFFSLRAPVKGLVRLVVDPAVMAEAARNGQTDYGSVTITDVKVHDEPALDERSWWGWNLWTTGWRAGLPDERGYLYDSPDGLSGSLNFSSYLDDNKTGGGGAGGTNDVGRWTGENTGNDLAEPEKAKKGNNEYEQNDPFVQGPSFKTGIGKVSFRARTFYADQDQPSIVSLFVSTDPEHDKWDDDPVTNFYVTSSTYQLHTWESLAEDTGYRAIRLAIKGAMKGRSSAAAVQTPVQRVMIDEVVVAESITPHVAFQNVRPFRSGLRDFTVVTNILSADQQPLTGESWGIQAEVTPRQMGDDIDMSSVRVYMAYHVGMSPWGAENWTNSATRVELPRVGTNLVWRSDFDDPATLVPPVDAGGTVVQYFLWAEFRDRNQSKGEKAHVHLIDETEWTAPEWYSPVDYNDSFASAGWSPFTILDTVSPYRAWINEVNYYDADVKNPSNYSKTNQYVEIAVPAGADLTGWSLNAVVGYWGYTISFPLATLGYGSCVDAARKIFPKTNDYVFISVQCPKRQSEGKASADGTWCSYASGANAYFTGGTFNSVFPAAFELKRKSGVVEHRIVVEGNNILKELDMDSAYMGSGTNLCDYLLTSGDDKWFFVGEDTNTCSLGVWRNHGENGKWPNDPALDCWTNAVQTPGVCNAGQIVPEGWYLMPGGTNIWVYAFATGDHIQQWTGTETNKALLMVVRYGGSTNVTYRLDPWYSIASMTTNTATGGTRDVPGYVGREGEFSVKIEDVRETTTLEATDGVAARLVNEYGLTADNPYTPAVLDWLKTGEKTKNGGEIYKAEYHGLDDALVGLFSLTEMYWLDIPPTEEGWIFKAGLTDHGGGAAKTAEEVVHTNKVGGVVTEVVTNMRVNVFMLLTNSVSGVHYAPQRLRGLTPGEESSGYSTSSSAAWTSVTFRVTGALRNGRVDNVYQPLRWFVFGPDSFGAPGTPDEYTARIEVTDPFSTGAPTYSKGWAPYRGCPVWYGFSIKGGLEYNTVEMLNSNSVYKVEK